MRPPLPARTRATTSAIAGSGRYHLPPALPEGKAGARAGPLRRAPPRSNAEVVVEGAAV